MKQAPPGDMAKSDPSIDSKRRSKASRRRGIRRRGLFVPLAILVSVLFGITIALLAIVALAIRGGLGVWGFGVGDQHHEMAAMSRFARQKESGTGDKERAPGLSSRWY